ncbi:hypothetical protein CRG98_010731 [Punica granatum]|uniref:Uncharacterized protein n=1 Tax=Punica granatum TaxID=22663 RepID=A0A2I0KM32_PUNGR|nr:hypothetical protein CRG98_010731 [Punica granatum]
MTPGVLLSGRAGWACGRAGRVRGRAAVLAAGRAGACGYGCTVHPRARKTGEGRAGGLGCIASLSAQDSLGYVSSDTIEVASSY